MVEILNKRDLAHRLGVSVPSVSAWLLRYGAAFPVVERGARGMAWRFDLDAVRAFLAARQAEEAAAEARLGAQLAGLPAPAGLPGQDAPAPSPVREQLDAWKLRRLQREEAERTGALIPAETVRRAAEEAFGRLGRTTRAFFQQIGREQRWPEPLLRERERQLIEVMRASIAALRVELAERGAAAPQAPE